MIRSPASRPVTSPTGEASGRFWRRIIPTNLAPWLNALGIGIAVGVMLLGSIAMIGLRNDAWRQAQQSAGNLLLALDRDIVRNFSVLELSLQGVMEASAEPGIDRVSPTIRQHALFDRSASADDLGSILVLDKNGHVTADSTSLSPHRLDLSDRDYFRVHRESANAGLFISRTFASRLAGGDLRIAISRRINDGAGNFAGVVSATLRLTYLRRLFERLDIGSKGSIVLLRTDGRILFRYPFRPQDVDVDLAGSPNFTRFKEAASGQYVAVAKLDGIERLYTFRHLGDLPLILSVSLSTEEILTPWRHKAMVIGPVLLVLCGFAVLSAVLLRYEMKRRIGSERHLAELTHQLTIQVATDGLTGLCNRRGFDAEMERSFGNAIRQGKTLALLMIDADYFKRFNDTYGHMAGDDVLRAIARCLRGQLRRPYDTGARYGGEEFVAILPDTDLHAAFALAERVRTAVRELRTPHETSPIGIVTVSIGVATIAPLIGDHANTLIRRADQGLYAAKQAGRDSTRCIAPSDSAASFGLVAPRTGAARQGTQDGVGAGEVTDDPFRPGSVG